ncbi:MAG: LptF/LptG family permease, partial [Bdellovibrionaceae bacterium]|nr:LptF/LptG family permease [Pseudobdellovibrionaceae bacterium]
MFFTLIDRYIARLFAGFFIAGLLVFVSLFITVDFMSNINRFDAPVEAVGRFYAYAVPGIIYQMIPVACLLGTIFTLSALNRNNELVALFSSGMSLA